MLDPETPSSETIYRIPPQHRHCHLHNFDWSRLSLGEKGKEVVEDFLERWQEGDDPHLVFTGRPGVGKTHCALGIYRAGVYHTNLTDSIYIRVPEFSDYVKQTFNDEDIQDPFREVKKASLVVLDDLFGREPSKWVLNQIIPRLISIAYDNSAGLVVTTNDSKKQIQGRLHSHEASRLFSNTKVLKFEGKDQRIR